MAPTKIAIACQGGGSQTAFTAGALKALIEANEAQAGKEFETISVSGTSGGAVCAALLWYAARKKETPRWKRLIDFWVDNTAHGWAEERHKLGQSAGGNIGGANDQYRRWRRLPQAFPIKHLT